MNIVHLEYCLPGPNVVELRANCRAIIVRAHSLTGDILTSGTMRGMADWLKANGYQYILGTQGFWEKTA